MLPRLLGEGTKPDILWTPCREKLSSSACTDSCQRRDACAQSEQSRPEASSAVAPAAGGGDEGMWVPEEYLGHEAAARELESEAAGGEAGAWVPHGHFCRPVLVTDDVMDWSGVLGCEAIADLGRAGQGLVCRQ